MVPPAFCSRAVYPHKLIQPPFIRRKISRAAKTTRRDNQKTERGLPPPPTTRMSLQAHSIQVERNALREDTRNEGREKRGYNGGLSTTSMVRNTCNMEQRYIQNRKADEHEQPFHVPVLLCPYKRTPQPFSTAIDVVLPYPPPEICVSPPAVSQSIAGGNNHTKKDLERRDEVHRAGHGILQASISPADQHRRAFRRRHHFH